MTSLLAFLHYVAAFVLAASLVVEFVLIRNGPTVTNARKLRIADLVFGASAGAVVVIGLLRVIYFERGAAYYLHSAPFIAKVVALCNRRPGLNSRDGGVPV